MSSIATVEFAKAGNLDAKQVLAQPETVKATIFAALAMDFYTNPTLDLPKGCCEAALEISKHIRAIQIRKLEDTNSPEAYSHFAAQVLVSKSAEFTGADRALAAAVRLHFNGKTPVTARMINAENDLFQGNYITNITNAVSAAVKDGNLKQEESSEGHGKFLITEAGLARIHYLRHKVPAEERERAIKVLAYLAA